ncbi:MAG: ATP-dependent zinc metalloprotease FtsH [Coriobacteriales bacterium]
MQQGGPDRRPTAIFYYILIVVCILLLLNAFTFPAMMQQKEVREVTYSEFLNMLDEGDINEVSLDQQNSEIQFTTNDEPDVIYETGVFPDENLINTLEEANVTFTAEIPQQDSPWLYFLLSWIIPIVIFVIIGQVMVSQMGKTGENVMSFGKSNAKIVAETDIKTTFADVAGQDEAKEELTEIVGFLHNPQKYQRIGARLPKGALLVGPPGTGKTLLARAVAGEAHVPFFSMSGSEFVEMFVGMGASKIRDLFKQANEKAPCIVFIDEIDAIGKKRGSGMYGGNDEREQTLNQLLTEMDGFDSREGVVILAATNQPESLDPALLRPGRFDRRIPVQLPDLQGREAILKVHAKKVRTVPNIDYGVIARMTSGSSGADLANIVNEAALRAVREGRNAVEQEDLQESVEVVIAGHQRKNAILSPEEKKIVSYHETGHALVAARQTGSAPVTKITIVPRTSGALGYTMQVDTDEKSLYSKEDLLQRITTLTGGRAAEELVFGTCTTGASNDIEKATQLARSMVTQYGMTDEFGMVQLEKPNNTYLGGDTVLNCSNETATKIDAKTEQIVAEAKAKADKILANDREKLDQIAGYLLERESITGDEFMELLEK